MEIEEVIKNLEHHNKWRRDDNVPNSYPMLSPKILGETIDEAIRLLKEYKAQEVQ